MKIQSSYITLNNLQFYAFHGVAPQETKVGNTFVVNVTMKIDFTKAAVTDDVEQTVSYADVFLVIQKVMKQPSKLLEHVIYRIATALFEEFSAIQELQLSLAKNNPPMGADIDSAAVSLDCIR